MSVRLRIRISFASNLNFSFLPYRLSLWEIISFVLCSPFRKLILGSKAPNYNHKCVAIVCFIAMPKF